jgi:hypothetical protein
MIYLHQDAIRARAYTLAQRQSLSVEDQLSSVAFKILPAYDIFLSQTTRDAELVLGVYDLLTDMGFTVFCDWISAPESHRNDVTPTNAAILRDVMCKCASLLFLDTENSVQSLWMCWELGWFDGQNGHIAVLPVLPDAGAHYRGREFLGLYPCIQVDESGRLKVVRPSTTNRHGITLLEAPNSVPFARWKDGSELMRPRTIDHWGA